LHLAAGLIVGGLLLVALAVLSARRA
jgi:hypothetical protein